MDGFGSNEGVIVLAATNRPDVLDSALLRAGRFDRQIVVSMPDAKAREEILKVHSKNKKLSEDISLEVVAKNTAGFAGADLENVLNEAALLAARKEKEYITEKDIEEEKGELKEIVDFLKNPQKYIEMGARIPKGVLLVGRPGTR